MASKTTARSVSAKLAPVVEELAACKRLILLCGRYEGFDQRIVEILPPFCVDGHEKIDR